jgi:putative DNA primase/helicase
MIQLWGGNMNFSSDNKKAINMFGNSLDQAKFFLDENPVYFDETQCWWAWDEANLKYKMVDEFAIENIVRHIINDEVILNSKQRFSLIHSLKLESRKRKPQEFKKTWIQFKDKVYDYMTGDVFDAGPEYFNCNPIPWDIGESAETPIIDSLFEQWVGKDEVITLKQICAFALVQDYFLHRVVCLTGSGCNGKGRFLAFVTKLIGDDNCASSELDLLIKSNFGTSALHKKLLCLMGETDFGVLSTTGRLKSLSGQDKIQAQYKGKDQFHFYNYAKLFISTNTIPATTDKTDGFYRRWLIVDFPNKFKEGSDPIESIPEIEYSNFLRQIFPMIAKLKKTGLFHNDGDVEHRKQRYESKSNPFPKFLSDNYVKSGPEDYVEAWDMYNSYAIYLNERGLRRINFNEFKKVCELENITIEEDKMYKDVFDREENCFKRKQVRVKLIYFFSLINKKDKKDKQDIKNNLEREYKADLKIMSHLPYLSYDTTKTDKNSASLVHQYIKNNTEKEYFVSDLVDFVSTTEEAQKIFNKLVENGELMLTANNGYKAVLK